MTAYLPVFKARVSYISWRTPRVRFGPLCTYDYFHSHENFQERRKILTANIRLRHSPCFAESVMYSYAGKGNHGLLTQDLSIDILLLNNV